ncbi:MAG: hypothetical protein WC690_05645 [bacterium]
MDFLSVYTSFTTLPGNIMLSEAGEFELPLSLDDNEAPSIAPVQAYIRTMYETEGHVSDDLQRVAKGGHKIARGFESMAERIVRATPGFLTSSEEELYVGIGTRDPKWRRSRSVELKKYNAIEFNLYDLGNIGAGHDDVKKYIEIVYGLGNPLAFLTATAKVEWKSPLFELSAQIYLDAGSENGIISYNHKIRYSDKSGHQIDIESYTGENARNLHIQDNRRVMERIVEQTFASSPDALAFVIRGR